MYKNGKQSPAVQGSRTNFYALYILTRTANLHIETPAQSDGKGVCTPKHNQVLTQPTDGNDSKREFKLKKKKRKRAAPCWVLGSAATQDV